MPVSADTAKKPVRAKRRRTVPAKIEAFVNPLAGSAGPEAGREMAELFEEMGIRATIHVAEPGNMESELAAMRARNPDLMVVLAGDGTARAAATLCGPAGPLLAPLAGGTMNVLPHALYGEDDWRSALRKTLSGGTERSVGGGDVGGHRFYVAAMLGSAARFAPAREAMRHHHPLQALGKAREAWSRAFTGRIRFTLDGQMEHKALALALICPLISRRLDDGEACLEAVAFDPHSPLEAIRIGARFALGPVFGDWRMDAAVDAGSSRGGSVRSRRVIPALLDGEPVRIGREARFRFHAQAFRAYAPPPDPEEEL